MKKLFTIAIVGILLMTGCSSGGTAAESKVDAIKAVGKLTMYTNAEFPPYEFMENDEIVGVDVEIGKAIADKLGVTLDIQNAEFSGIVAAIATGKGDIGLSGITINDDRKTQVDFSTPYVDSVQYIIVPEDSTLSVMEDFAGLVIGGQTGTTGAMLVETEIAEGVLKDAGAEIKTYNSAPVAMQDLIAGRIAAVVIDELVAMSIADANEGYKAVPFAYKSGAPVTEQFGVAVAKGNEDLLKVIDEAVQEMLDQDLIQTYIDQYSAVVAE